MGKQFDSKRIEAIFTLVSTVKENIRAEAINAAMANLVKALRFYLATPMLKKERAVLEAEFETLQLKIGEHPKFKGAYGPVTFTAGDHAMTIDFMTQLIKFGADSLQEKIEQGLELMEAERQDEARALFEEVIGDPDAELKHFFTIGDAYLKKSRWKEAQEIFHAALKKYPDSINALNRMAISLRKDQLFPQAMDYYKRALLLSPRDEGLFYNMARLLLDMGHREKAVQALKKSLSLNKDFKPAAALLEKVQDQINSKKETGTKPA
ncbi:MAG: tetratricopeptide repeat protein [Pseudomonadota bacterium]